MKKYECPHCGKTWKVNVGRPRTVDYERIKSMRAQGFKMREISQILKVSIGAVQRGCYEKFGVTYK